MKLYLITQEVNSDYDTYDSAIVAANSEEDAKKIHPNGRDKTTNTQDGYGAWATLKDVKVEYIGEAEKSIKKGVVLASFNAG